MIKPLYKIGDKVLVKSNHDEECNPDNYPFIFTPFMLEKFGGHTCTISSIRKSGSFKKEKIPSDNYIYSLEEDIYQFFLDF